MDQIKIGNFIAACRKAQGLTQAQLAERLNLTDRAISKWETGKGMPDSSVMLDLCESLGISVNELLRGEKIEMENYNKVAEETLLEMKRESERQHRAMLRFEIVLGVISVVAFLALLFVAEFFVELLPLKVGLFVTAFLLLLVGMGFSLRIEQTAGYYACACCGHRYVPGYRSVFFAMHMGRTRYMKCPKCGKRSWNKKVLTKE
ncbi:MAG: helix-turn-helix transcriptional regulator [Oscillospiraceae bacterium]|nr:helix-turn-helix transcriptional regulator [Oscillospiraceae bacterium]